MFSLLNVILSSTVVILVLFYSVQMFRNIRNRLFDITRAQEILTVFNILKEDILKSADIKTDRNKIILRGFLLSFSDDENDRDWGIVLNCSDGIAQIYNLNPKEFIWEFREDKTIELYRVYEKIKISENTYKVNLSSCPSPYSLCFSDLYEIHWHSERGKIYRESFRNDGAKIHHSKFFVANGEIVVSNKNVVLENKGFKIGFNVP